MWQAVLLTCYGECYIALQVFAPHLQLFTERGVNYLDLNHCALLQCGSACQYPDSSSCMLGSL